MDKLNHLIEVARQSHNTPWILSFLVGFFAIRKVQYVPTNEDEVLGDNIPATLIENIER